MTAEVGTRTTAAMLYLSVELGDQPGLANYARSVGALTVLSTTSAAFVLESPLLLVTRRWEDWRLSELRDQGVPPLRVVRTSMASPWVTVLADLARTAAPIGYGVATLYGLHQLLQMIMAWQRHQLDIAERKQQLDQVRRDVQRATNRVLGAPPRIAEVGGSEVNTERVSQVNDAGVDLGPIQTAEWISADDPRATGTGPAAG